MQEITVYKGRTMTLAVKLSYDVSGDTITSQIREGRSHTTPLIASWHVAFKTDGTDGALVLTLDDQITSAITASSGFMDLKRITDGEPVAVFDDPLIVIFKDVITL